MRCEGCERELASYVLPCTFPNGVTSGVTSTFETHYERVYLCEDCVQRAFRRKFIAAFLTGLSLAALGVAGVYALRDVPSKATSLESLAAVVAWLSLLKGGFLLWEALKILADGERERQSSAAILHFRARQKRREQQQTRDVVDHTGTVNPPQSLPPNENSYAAEGINEIAQMGQILSRAANLLLEADTVAQGRSALLHVAQMLAQEPSQKHIVRQLQHTSRNLSDDQVLPLCRQVAESLVNQAESLATTLKRLGKRV